MNTQDTEEHDGEVSEKTTTTTAPPPSTLIEFPGAGRGSLPQWRKQLSERVREIQERRARDAEREAKEAERRRREQPANTAAPQLGLVPPPDAPPVNPLVAAALKRIERAHQPPPPMPRARMSGAAVAVARVAEEQYETDAQAAPLTRPLPVPAPVKAVEPPREHGLAVVATRPTVKAETVAAGVVETQMSAPLDSEMSEPVFIEELYDDRAPVISRLAGGFIDLLVVAFASSPFAAIIELTNGNWMDTRVSGSMGGIVALVMFLYLTASTAMAGRTWGMSLVSLRAVDADTGLLPTNKQAALRALVYMISLATLGLGILYALVDAEGRTAHDHFSGTAVVRE